MSKIAVIGGGASGMCAAFAAAEAGAEVYLFEHNDRLGKKLAATGNGKCNLGNAVYTDACYRGDGAFAKKVFDIMSPEAVRDYLIVHGLPLRDRRGYFYPHSEQAASVVTFFASRLTLHGVRILLSSEVTGVKAEDRGFSVRFCSSDGAKQTLFVERVIVSAGGLAGENLGAGGIGYDIAKTFGHHVTPLFPALVQLMCKDSGTKKISGVRTDASVRLHTDTGGVSRVFNETGEILFTDYGISGIPVLMLSRYAGDALMNRGTAEITLDFFPDRSAEELSAMIGSLLSESGNGTQNGQNSVIPDSVSTEDMLAGLLPKKLLYKILCDAKVPAERPFSELTRKETNRIVSLMKAFRLPVTGTRDYPSAQVTAGGIETSEIDSRTLESRLQKGIYFTGELLNVDGTCGGYNLQFAFATGILAGIAASEE